jgi:hypothetical protein
MGRDLCKLMAQITFDSDDMTTLKLRGPDSNSHGGKGEGMATLCL